MTKEPICLEADHTVEEAIELMSQHHIIRIPVVSAGKLVGIVSRTDILRAYVKEEFQRLSQSEARWNTSGPDRRYGCNTAVLRGFPKLPEVQSLVLQAESCSAAVSAAPRAACGTAGQRPALLNNKFQGDSNE
ncbi:MAG: CBS domain-containing protein [Candidatus Sulfotelmatobacter sp.]